MRRAWTQLVEEQHGATADQVVQWQARAEVMRREHARLVASGAWATGPPTLMAALWAQHSEVMLTRALAWLLRPGGRHGLGSGALDALADHLKLDRVKSPAEVRVVTEETRIFTTPEGQLRPTRADLVIYTPGWTLVVEAKVFAPEQPAQLDRLHALWADDASPCWVFLTRGRQPPLTARCSAGLWHERSWAQVARVLRGAVAGRDPVPGVLDFIETLEEYHRG